MLNLNCNGRYKMWKMTTMYYIIHSPINKLLQMLPFRDGGLNRQGYPQEKNWSHSESKHHINYLEMLAVLLGLQTFAKNNNTHIRIMCDNTAAVNVINHMRTSHSDPCNSVAKKIWECCIACKIWLSAAHHTW